jgi:hypothetical protein
MHISERVMCHADVDGRDSMGGIDMTTGCMSCLSSLQFLAASLRRAEKKDTSDADTVASIGSGNRGSFS